MRQHLATYEVRGSFEEAGASYGEAIRETIATSLERWAQGVGGEGVDPLAYSDFLATRPGYRDALQKYAPNFLAFIRGVARGASQPFERILSYNLMDEDWEHRPRVIREKLFLSTSQRCSSVAGASATGVVAGQNMDIGGLTEGTQCLLKIASNTAGGDLYFLATGPVPTCGFNSAGLSVLLNTVAQLQPQAQGLPVAGFQFELLTKGSRADALQMLEETPHASGHAYTVVDASGVECLECSADGATVVPRRLANGVFTRTNHPLAMISLRRVETPEDEYFRHRLGSSVERLAQVDAVCGAVDALTADVVKKALSCRRSEADAVSREAGDVVDPASGQTTINFTAGSLVCEFDRDGGIRAHIAPGPPSCTAYVSVDVTSSPGGSVPETRALATAR